MSRSASHQIKTPLDLLYAAIHRAENKVGGGEGLVGIYGSMTQQGTDNIMKAMAQHAGLDRSSILVDIGSGLCRPLLHATVQFNVHRTYGVELDAVKCQKAVPFLQHAVAQLAAAGVQFCLEALPTIICTSVEQLGSLEPATHAYAAWEGFPVQAKLAVGDLFAASPSLRTITIVQRSFRNEDPAEVMDDLGFGPVSLVTPAIPVYMAGSHRRLNAYMFTKQPSPGTGLPDSAPMRGTRSRQTVPAGSGSLLPDGGTDSSNRGSRRQLPSLSDATPFDPLGVIEALARMGSGEGSAGRSCKEAAWSSGERGLSSTAGRANSRASRGRATEKEKQQQSDISDEEDLDCGDGVGGGDAGFGLGRNVACVGSGHAHGLRRNRKRSARSLQQDEGCLEEGSEEEGGGQGRLKQRVGDRGTKRGSEPSLLPGPPLDRSEGRREGLWGGGLSQHSAAQHGSMPSVLVGTITKGLRQQRSRRVELSAPGRGLQQPQLEEQQGDAGAQEQQHQYQQQQQQQQQLVKEQKEAALQQVQEQQKHCYQQQQPQKQQREVQEVQKQKPAADPVITRAQRQREVKPKAGSSSSIAPAGPLKSRRLNSGSTIRVSDGQSKLGKNRVAAAPWTMSMRTRGTKSS